MEILQTHYSKVIADILEILPGQDQMALEKATLFAKMRYKQTAADLSIVLHQLPVDQQNTNTISVTTVRSELVNTQPEVRLKRIIPRSKIPSRCSSNKNTTLNKNLPDRKSTTGRNLHQFKTPLSNVAVIEDDVISPWLNNEESSSPPSDIRTEDFMTKQISNDSNRTTNPPPSCQKKLRHLVQTFRRQLQTPICLQKPKYHQKCYQKIATWKLEVLKPILILGDSNLARILSYHPQIQIDSFPGAQVHHLVEVLKKNKPNHNVHTIIWSIGLNNALRLNHIETIRKQYQQLHLMTRKTFPQADIFFSKIQFSDEKSTQVKNILKNINEH